MYCFKQPLTILVGIGFPTRIETVNEAYALLEDWPWAQRDRSFEVARNACRACISGEVDAETVYGPFRAFAKKHELLITEAPKPLSPLQAGVDATTATTRPHASRQ